MKVTGEQLIPPATSQKKTKMHLILCSHRRARWCGLQVKVFMEYLSHVSAIDLQFSSMGSSYVMGRTIPTGMLTACNSFACKKSTTFWRDYKFDKPEIIFLHSDLKALLIFARGWSAVSRFALCKTYLVCIFHFIFYASVCVCPSRCSSVAVQETLVPAVLLSD